MNGYTKYGLMIVKTLLPAAIIGILAVAYADSSSSIADNYESDNSAQTASDYYLFSSEYQIHNFHVPGDEDWIKFYTNKDFDAVEITTSEPGKNCETVITLFDADKTTQIKEQNFTLSSGVSLMSFKPDKDGTYYLRIKNKDPSKYGSDTGYKLSIYFPVAPFSGTVAGTVSDNSSKFPVEGVQILIENNYTSATTELDGFYFLQCPAGKFTLYASKNGYTDYSTDIEVMELGNTEINITLHKTLPAQRHASLHSALAITIPCIDFQGLCPQITLDHYINPSDGANFFWKLDIDSIGFNQSCSSDCAFMDNDFTITIPKIEYNGSFYQIVLNNYSNPNDSTNFYWGLGVGPAQPP